MQAAAAHEPEEEAPDFTMGRTYPWVLAWGRLHGFSDQVVLRHLWRAARELAPPTVLYYTEAEVWLTLEDVTNPETRLWLLDWAQSRDLPLPYGVIRAWITPDYAPASVDRG